MGIFINGRSFFTNIASRLHFVTDLLAAFYLKQKLVTDEPRIAVFRNITALYLNNDLQLLYTDNTTFKDQLTNVI